MKLLSPSWWVGMFINTFITIIFIYLIKMIASKVNVPIVGDIVEAA